MLTDVPSIMLSVTRGIMDRGKEMDTTAGHLGGAAEVPEAVRGVKRGDPEPDTQAAAVLTDVAGAECKRARIDGAVSADVGQVRLPLNICCKIQTYGQSDMDLLHK